MMDTSYPEIFEEDVPKLDWKQFYKTEGELIPSNAPKTKGLEMFIRAMVDLDHVGDKISIGDQGLDSLYFEQCTSLLAFKKQAGVETSNFGSEFLVMKVCCKYLRGLRYKIRMMGIPIEHCYFVYGDNRSVLYNTSLPDSTLSKKHLNIAYHFLREGCANDEWRTVLC